MMGLRTSATYVVNPQPGNLRQHFIPIEAARHIVNDPEALGTCLDERACVVEITIVEGGNVIARIPKTIVFPTSGNEIYCTQDKFPNYPATLSPNAKLVVEIVLL
jgi:hypothetical protein